MRCFRDLASLTLSGWLLAWSAPALAQDPPPPPAPQAPPAPARVLEVAAEPPTPPTEGPGTSQPGEKRPGEKSPDAAPWAPTLAIFGVQFGKTDAPGYPNPGLSGALYMQSRDFTGEDDRTEFASTRLVLGGGSAGFEAALDLNSLRGLSLRLNRDQILFGRVGFLVSLWGNRQIYSSLFSLPEGQLGWQMKRGHSVVELGLHGGLVVAGRFHPGIEDSRKLGGSAEYGPYAAIHVGMFHADLDVVRVDSLADQPGARVDNLRGSLCLTPAAVAICLRGDWLHGGPSSASSRTVDAFYTGLVIGTSVR